MERDLSELMAEALDARTRTMSADGVQADVTGVASRVRRRRMVRHAVEGAVALPVVAAVVTAGWFGLRHGTEPAPVATSSATVEPTPSAEPSPSLSPGPTPTAGPTAEPEPVAIEEEGLPPYFALPDGLLEQASPGWVLATYLPYYYDADAEAYTSVTGEVVFLVSPEGVRYEVLRLPKQEPLGARPDGSSDEPVAHRILAWEPGTRVALVQENRGGPTGGSDGSVRRLDLVTGALSEAPDLSPPLGSIFVGRTIDGRLAWFSEAEGSVSFTGRAGAFSAGAALAVPAGTVSPDGSHVLVAPGGARVIDLASGASVELPWPSPAGWCEGVGWESSDTVLALCYKQDPHAGDFVSYADHGAALVGIPLSGLSTGRGALLHRIGVDELVPWGGLGTLSDGTVTLHGNAAEPGLGPLSEPCETGAYLFRGGRYQRLPGSDLHPELVPNIFDGEVANEKVYLLASSGCSGDQGPAFLSTYEPVTGTTVELLPPPTAREDDSQWYVQGLVSYVVAR